MEISETTQAGSRELTGRIPSRAYPRYSQTKSRMKRREKEEEEGREDQQKRDDQILHQGADGPRHMSVTIHSAHYTLHQSRPITMQIQCKSELRLYMIDR